MSIKIILDSDAVLVALERYAIESLLPAGAKVVSVEPDWEKRGDERYVIEFEPGMKVSYPTMREGHSTAPVVAIGEASPVAEPPRNKVVRSADGVTTSDRGVSVTV